MDIIQLCTKCQKPLEKWKVKPSWRGWTCRKCQIKHQYEYVKKKALTDNRKYLSQTMNLPAMTLAEWQVKLGISENTLKDKIRVDNLYLEDQEDQNET